MRRLALLALVAGAASLVTAAPAAAVRAGCTPAPVHAPWLASPVTGPVVDPPFLSAHRGGTNLAPQQTAEAHKSALAFGATVTEVDLHVLADGAVAAYHDDETPDGRGLGTITTAEFKALNAATGSWAGTAFDPARYLLFDEVLAIAAGAGAGLDIEFKDLNPGSPNPGSSSTLRGPYAAVAQAVADAGLMGSTIWQYNQSQPDLLQAVKAVDPGAHFNYNILDPEPAALLFAQASTNDFSYGSSLDKFTPERLAAIHDGCAIAVPHSYDAGPAEEANQIRLGRARGVDGFQTNQVDIAVAALGRPVPASWTRPMPTTACLVNPDNGYGLLGRTVRKADGTTLVVGPGGCVDAGLGPMAFAGDGAALPAYEDAPAPAVPEGSLAVALVTLLGAGLVSLVRRRRGAPG